MAQLLFISTLVYNISLCLPQLVSSCDECVSASSVTADASSCFGRSQLVWTQWAGYRCGRDAHSGAIWPKSMQCTGGVTPGTVDLLHNQHNSNEQQTCVYQPMKEAVFFK